MSCTSVEKVEWRACFHPAQPSRQELAPADLTSLYYSAFSNNFNLDEVHVFHELLASLKSCSCSPIKSEGLAHYFRCSHKGDKAFNN